MNKKLAIACVLLLAALLGASYYKVSLAGSANRLERGTFYIEVTETIDEKPTDKNISQELITRELVIHGLRPAKSRDKARYLVEGKVTVRFHQKLTFDFAGQSQLLEMQYKGEFTCDVTDTTLPEGDPNRTETFEIPTKINGRTDDVYARRDIRRLLATEGGWLLVKGKILGHPQANALIAALQNPEETRTFNEIHEALAALGRPAVPHLLDAMLNENEVELKGEYPKLTEENRDLLKVYHIADLALSDILLALSYLELESEEDELIRVLTGWAWAWEDDQGIPKRFRMRRDERDSAEPATATARIRGEGTEEDHR